ncbi:Uncharacterised protein [Mycobacteroides abscessus subsp. abscessus]|nr:Uncharacterised protein [Mycobacteroides abscessus subsp. abscessus]
MKVVAKWLGLENPDAALISVIVIVVVDINFLDFSMR